MAGSGQLAANGTPSTGHFTSNHNGGESRERSGSAVRAVREKGPLASRDGSAQKAAQDVEGLKDYQLGDCLGKGAFGSVYRALNWGTGETVAIKQVRLSDLPRSELKVIMLEIDLLKNLNHPNIVKYNGFVKATDSLYIILEYCENGSLHTICKNFGKFPENLVALYMSQVLHGLVYLHDQGVIHRDIKGANILTTKEGLVKLADFGVATKAAGLDESNVVGTPYWMAPEVIELTGATTASDIWSLGSTVIELLDGKPPYHKLQPMQALFRIVNDEHPPLPTSASPVVRDFLMQCFQKNPNLRISAKRLLKHPWISSAKRADAVVPIKPTKYDEAVKSVQEWNEALKSPNSDTLRRSTRAVTSSLGAVDKEPVMPAEVKPTSSNSITTNRPHLNIPKIRSSPDAFRSPEVFSNNWDDDFVSSESKVLNLVKMKPQDNFAGQLSSARLKSFATFDSVMDDSNLEGFPDSDLTLKAFSREPSKSNSKAVAISTTPPIPEQSTANVPRAQARRKSSLTEPVTSIWRGNLPVPKTRKSRSTKDNAVEDYSDLLEIGEEEDFDNKAGAMQLRITNPLAPKLFDPSDLTPTSHKPQLKTLPSRNSSASSLTDRPLQRSQSDITEIQKFVEHEGDDFSDFDNDSEMSALALNSKMSASFAEEDELDPFAAVEDNVAPTNLSDDVAHAKAARMQKQTEELVGRLKTNQPFETIEDITDQLLGQWGQANDDERDIMKRVILKSHGILPILDILKEEPAPPRNISVPLLKILNLILLDNSEALESTAFLGGIPAVTEYGHKRYATEERQEAAAFVRQMCKNSQTTLQFFIACGGIDTLVAFLEEDLSSDRDIVLIGVTGLWSVFFNQHGPTPRNDYCRILSQQGVLHPLSLILTRLLSDEDKVSKMMVKRLVSIFLIFSQAEGYVKEIVCDRLVMNRVLRALSHMSGENLITMLKFVKNLSMLDATHDALESSNVIDTLTDLLRVSKSKPYHREVANQVINTVFNICRLNRSRQEEAALNGIIPLLKEAIVTQWPLKEFALPILCDMAHAGKVCRSKLWEQDGLQFYISLLSDTNWQVSALDAIHVWLQEETARVEQNLLRGTFTAAITECFSRPEIHSDAFEGLLEPLQKILFLSPPLASTFAARDFFQKTAQKFTTKRAVTKLGLLRVLTYICESTEGSIIRRYEIEDNVRDLLETDDSVLVQNLANGLLKLAYERPSSSGSSSTPLRMRQTSMGRKGFPSFTPPTPTATYRNRPAPRRPVVLNQALPSPTIGATSGTPPPLTRSQTTGPTVPESKLPRRESTSYHPSLTSVSTSLLYTTPPGSEPRKHSSTSTPSHRPGSRDNSAGSATSILSSISSTSLSSIASSSSATPRSVVAREGSRISAPPKRSGRFSLAFSGSTKKGEENVTPPDRTDRAERSLRPASQSGPGAASVPQQHKLHIRRRRETSSGIVGEGNGANGGSKRGS